MSLKNRKESIIYFHTQLLFLPSKQWHENINARLQFQKSFNKFFLPCSLMKSIMNAYHMDMRKNQLEKAPKIWYFVVVFFF
jgi:hypothetical protein